jgi:transposase, IS5 family
LKFKNAIIDRGYKEKKTIGEAIVISPGPQKAKSYYGNQTMSKKCLSREAIEPIIGHVKYDCRMARN